MADKLDSLESRHDTVLVKYFFFNTDSLDMGKLYTERTSHLDNFQRYEPLTRNGLFTSLGNVGLAHESMIFNPHIFKGFQYNINYFSQYTRNNQNTAYFIHDRPVSYLEYKNGGKKEQLFRAMLSHKILKAVIIAADFSLINSPGDYYNQKSDDKNLALTAQYYTKDKRFGVLANYNYNKFIVKENGGITNDSLFEYNTETDRSLIDVNLSSALNQVKQSGGHMNTYFYLSKGTPVNDSVYVRPKTFHAGRISYSFNYTNNSQRYTDSDPASEFYHPYDPILDSTETFDSLHIRTLENSFSWSNMRLGEDFSKKFLYVNFAFTHQMSQYSDTLEKMRFTQLIPSADIRIHPFSLLSIGGHGHYILGDFNNNGFLLKADAKLDVGLGKEVRGILDGEVGLANQEPAYFFSSYRGNNFRWDTTFNHENYRWFAARLSVWKFTVGAKYTSVSNYTYLGQDAHPKQYTGNINILQLTYDQTLRIGVWNLDVNLVYQTASRPEAIHLPLLAGRASFFPTLSLFQNAAILQPGIDVFYNTYYYADGYMPALRSFYWQDQTKVGNYYYMDVFISLMVKRFRIFVKYQHINSLWGPTRYYTVPHYPMEDARFKWGLSWSFYD